MTLVNIPELFRAVAAKVNTTFSTRSTDPFPVYFDYGRYLEITRRLTQKTMGVESKSERFPLIWLVIPFEERNGQTEEYTDLTNLQIIIATLTKPDSTTPDRIADNFIPRLYPIYFELLNQVKESGYFSDIGYGIEHRKIDQPYWDGKDGVSGGGANMFDDFIDAIQLKNISLTVNESTCDRFRLIGA